MAERTFELGVIVARRHTQGPWPTTSWRPVAVLAAAPPLEPGARITTQDGEDLLYAGAATLAVHSSETAHYRDNLCSGSPSLWVAIASEDEEAAVRMVTADPYEGEALAEIYGEALDVAPMPEPIRDAIASFVAEHHVERPFAKRKRT